MRILIIEDDKLTANSIELALASEKSGMVCDSVEYGEEGVEIAKLYDYDLVILDLMLPGINGYEVLRRIRAARVTIPIIILSGAPNIDDRVRAFQAGANDFIAKPYNRDEFVARVHAAIRSSREVIGPIIKLDKLTINMAARSVEVDDRYVHLTIKEYAILELLVMNSTTVITKDKFLDKLYGGRDEPEIKIIDVFVCKLRKKLADASGGTNYIETIWGRGYILKDFENKNQRIHDSSNQFKRPVAESMDESRELANKHKRPVAVPTA